MGAMNVSHLAQVVKDNIVRLLDEKQISRAELARRMEIAQPSVIRMLNGEHELRTDTIERIADAIGVDPLELLTEVAAA